MCTATAHIMLCTQHVDGVKIQREIERDRQTDRETESELILKETWRCESGAPVITLVQERDKHKETWVGTPRLLKNGTENDYMLYDCSEQKWRGKGLLFSSRGIDACVWFHVLFSSDRSGCTNVWVKLNFIFFHHFLTPAHVYNNNMFTLYVYTECPTEI